MGKCCKYTVAGHTFAVTLPEGYAAEDHLKPYAPFQCSDDSIEPLFSLDVVLTDNLSTLCPGERIECFNDEPPYLWMFRPEPREGLHRYWFAFSYSRSRPDCMLIPSEDLSRNTLHVPSAHASQLMEFAISNSMMLLYTFRTTPYDTLMVHASVISHAGAGYMFLGKSGTGKSTHSRLWLEHIEDTSLLNDDNPVIRIVDGQPLIYGTPWSGKTHCYRNEVLPLKAVVRLSQAPFNRISVLPPLKSYASLMPACSCMRWDRASTDALHKTVERVITKVRGYHLECLPDGDAARVCHSAVTEA